MKDNEILIGELLALKDEIALHKHLMSQELHDEWDVLKKKTKALEPKLSGTLLSLVKKTAEADSSIYSGSDSDIHQLLSEFKAFKNRFAY